MGFTDEYLEKTFHHEFSSILLRNYPEYFDEKLWTEQNSIHYGKGGVQAIKKGNDSQKFDSLMHLQGFLHQYAVSDMENDFNSFAENLFLPEKGFRDAVIRYVRLTNKLAIIMAFYHSIDKNFTLEYFEKFEH